MAHIPTDERRTDFINAAIRIIAKHGVEGATTRKIAEEAGAPLATLHYCFSTKDKLLAAVYDEQVHVLGGSVFRVEPGSGIGPAAALLLRECVDWYLQDSGLAAAGLDLVMWGRRRDQAMGRSAYARTFSDIETALRTAMIDTDDAELIPGAARILAVLMDGFLVQWIVNEDKDQLLADVEIAAESLKDRLSRG